MASPHVAGVAALFLQNNPTASPSAVTSAIIDSSTSGVVTGSGTGSPNRLLYSMLSSGGPPPPPPPPSCSGGTYGGSLSGAGANQYQPNGSYYQSTISGTHTGALTGPSNADFDLYLQKWSGSRWNNVASSLQQLPPVFHITVPPVTIARFTRIAEAGAIPLYN